MTLVLLGQEILLSTEYVARATHLFVVVVVVVVVVVYCTAENSNS
jgi:hypothetical protein